MGSGASKNKKPKETFKQKATVVGKLGAMQNDAQVASSYPSREIVITDTSAAWEMLRQGNDVVAADNLPKKTLAVNSGVTRMKNEDLVEEESLGIQYDINDEVVQEETCSKCGEDTGYTQYPCRICPRVFHEDCLRRTGQCQDGKSIEQLHRANTDIGWSCHLCENISNILTEEEMLELIENFDAHDVNQDAEINSNEFISYKKESYRKRFDLQLSETETDLEMMRFRSMDVDNTDTIDWWEFLNYESIGILQRRRKQNSVAQALSRKEIQRARESFQHFDIDHNGCVSEDEAREAYYRWYSKFFKENENRNRLKGISLDRQVKGSVSVLMSADTDDTGTVSWDEYLRDQAVFFISARPNNSKIFNANQIERTIAEP